MTDLEWLENKLWRHVPENELEHFSERVSILMFDGMCDENEAREFTLETWIK